MTDSKQNDALIIPMEEFRFLLKFMPEWNEPTGTGDHTILDWNTLMPVVEKITSLKFDVRIETSGDFSICDIEQRSNGYSVAYAKDPTPLIEATYKAIVDFIKWYNTFH